MDAPTLKTTTKSIPPIENGPAGTQLQQPSGGATVSVSVAQAPSDTAKGGSGSGRVIKGYFSDKLDDAERLLGYAAEVGIDVEDSIRNDVLKARYANDGGMDEQSAANLLSALTKLAAKMRPVTAESLKACAGSNQSRSIARFYMWVAIVLIAFIVPYSIIAFVSSGLSDRIRQDVVTANMLAVKLSDELQPAQANFVSAEGRGIVKPLPAGITVKDVITDLQMFASTIRAIDARSRELGRFAAGKVTDPFAQSRTNQALMKLILELPPGLPNLPEAAKDRIEVYKDVRYFATSNQETVSMIYGAIANQVLPMLYALLGACAYLARTLEDQIKNRTLTIADRHTVHFIIAGIGGLVVGLFTNFSVTQGVTLPPLAFAFLVGYAVDSFFSFLESLLQIFNKGRSNTAAPSVHP